MKSASSLHGNASDSGNHVSRTPPKNPNKKPSFSKSKTKKPSIQNTTSSSATSHQNAGGSSSSASMAETTSSSSGKEKAHHKSYAGLNSKSIKCIWEQHDKTDTEVTSEVYARLAEDATYKLWELANNLKTYARHSGGKLTVDLVNEVLKDCDVPPVIGAGSTSWHKIEYDGTYFFHFDEVLELRDEYLKDVKLTQCGPFQLTANWWANNGATEDLKQFCTDLCFAIFAGNEMAFNYAIHTTLINPYIGCIIKPIMVKCLEMLTTTYTDIELERCLQFLMAIIYNYHTRDANLNEILIHFSQIMSCILLGPLDLNSTTAETELKQEPYIHSKTTGQSTTNNSQIKMEEEISFISKELENIKQERTMTTAQSDNVDMNVDDMRNDYEDLMEMMKEEGFSGKMDTTTDGNSFRGFKMKEEPAEASFQSHSPFVKHESLEFNTENHSSVNSSLKIEQKGQQQPTVKVEPQQFSSLTTCICNDKYIDRVCRFIGLAADKWGYFEGEIIFVLSKRLERFFTNVNVWTAADYILLRRFICGLIALGDYAIREIIPYFNQIDSFFLPDY